MNLEQVIGELYASGIDCGIESYQGIGLTAWVVNERNRRIEREFAAIDLTAVAQWLLVEGARQAESRDAPAPLQNIHALLAALADSERKGPKRVDAPHSRRDVRQAGSNR